MSKTIYKYPFDVRIPQLLLPPAAKIMHIGYQEASPPHELMLWAMVPMGVEPCVPWQLYVAGTGHPLPEQLGKFLGSVQAGPFVWHVWEGSA